MKIALNCKNPQIALAIKVTELAILYDFPVVEVKMRVLRHGAWSISLRAMRLKALSQTVYGKAFLS